MTNANEPKPVQSNDAFYIGYQPQAPAPYARFTRRVVLLLVVLLLPLMGLVGAMQRPFDAGTFEFGVVKEFEGVLYDKPVPMLRVEDEATGEAENLLLVGSFKFGIPEEARAAAGKRIRFRGSLIHRKGTKMVEMNEPESIEVLGDAPDAAGATQPLSRMTLRGEIVDTKCFFGVMRPGMGKVHRACAIRCLSGGAPPGLRVVDLFGRETVFLLAGPEPGVPLDLDIELTAVPVEMTGDAELQQNIPILRVRGVRRL